MRTDAYFLQRKKTDSLTNLSAPELFVKPGLRNTLSRLGQAFFNNIAGQSDPQIWQSCDRNGNQSWHIYDPNTNQKACFASEKEVRIWLEQRYSR